MSFVRLRKNKKAILSFFLVVMATFVFAYAYFKLGGSIGVVTQLVGEKEFILVQQYEKGEAVKLYLDLSSRAVMGKSLFLFEYDGHYSACGKNGLYYLWKSEDKECYPTEQSISSGLSTVFVKLINPYIKNYKEFPLPELSSADISFDLAEKKLISYPFSSINISSDPLYLINPSFVVQCD
ncbi:hypothetical protein KY340_01455, partial [Candidatus Woesearchaeota archaeon]|nr:hypothetical protein [Candidatus Woesearchaeota archaeon]